MVRKILMFAFVSLMIIAFMQCTDPGVGSNEDMGSSLTGTYHYTSYDTTGLAIVKGWIKLYQDSTHITGEWDLKRIGNSQKIGPQVGSGDLIGEIDHERVWIELQPQYRDNNLQLNGNFEDGFYTGEWTWHSLVGISNYGSFKAVKN